MFHAAITLLTLTLLVESSFARSNTGESDIYCSMYRTFDDKSWDLLKTEGISKIATGFNNVQLASLPGLKGSNVRCGVGTATSSSGMPYEGVICSYDGLGQLGLIIQSPLNSAKQVPVQVKIQDFSGNAFLVRCEGTAPKQEQSLQLNDFAFVGEAENIMAAIRIATGSSENPSNLISSDGTFKLSCKEENKDIKCSARLNPRVSKNEGNLMVGVKGIDIDQMGTSTGTDFVHLKLVQPSDVALFTRFLGGKNEWRSDSQRTIFKFGGEMEQIPAAEIKCDAVTCDVTLNSYLLMSR